MLIKGKFMKVTPIKSLNTHNFYPKTKVNTNPETPMREFLLAGKVTVSIAAIPFVIALWIDRILSKKM